MSFFRELKRRHVFRVAIAYLALAWLLIEVADTLFPAFGIPGWAFRLVVILLVLGFVPVLVFSWAYEMTTEGLKREKDVVRDAATEQRAARRLDLLTIGLIVVALAFIAVDRLWLGSRPAEPPVLVAEQTAEPAPAEASGDGLPPDSIAVLPFANRSANPDDAFFVDGIHDDLLTHISQIGSLKVISRTSVMEYRDTLKKIPQIARELDVAHVLEGGVQRAGDQVRINVQLIDARSDDHLWSQIYDRQLTATNVFAIQSEIAGSIADALRAELTPQARERLERVPTENLEALEAYFLGRQNMASRRVADLAAAVEHFETAVALDPQFALAWVGLGSAIYIHADYSGISSDSWEDVTFRVKSALDQALTLDPMLGEAYASLAGLRQRAGDMHGAEEAYRRALELSPNYAPAYLWYAIFVRLELHRWTEALDLTRKAVSLDPKSPNIARNHGIDLKIAGRLDEALAEFERAIELEPEFAAGYREIGDLQAEELGRLDEAVKGYRKSFSIDPRWSDANKLGWLYLLLGDLDGAASWIGLAEELSPTGVIPDALGLLHLYRGETKQALESFRSRLAGNLQDGQALYYLAIHDLAAGDFTAAIARYERAFPGLFEDEPAVGVRNFGPAIMLATIHSQNGNAEKMRRLLDRALELTNSWGKKFLVIQASLHALRGDQAQSLELLNQSLNAGEVRFRQYLHTHPAFNILRDEPEFQALLDAFDAVLARQLEQVRAWEASGELPPLPAENIGSD